MLKVMFVCLGNICRSAMAECIFAHKVRELSIEDKFFISSAGTSDEEQGNPIYLPAKRKLQSEGIEIINHRAIQLKKSDYDKYDLFLCAEQNNVSSAIRIFGSDMQNKVKRMLDYSANPRNIADPWWTGDFDKTYVDISEACETLIEFARQNGFI